MYVAGEPPLTAILTSANTILGMPGLAGQIG